MSTFGYPSVEMGSLHHLKENHGLLQLWSYFHSLVLLTKVIADISESDISSSTIVNKHPGWSNVFER